MLKMIVLSIDIVGCRGCWLFRRTISIGRTMDNPLSNVQTEKYEDWRLEQSGEKRLVTQRVPDIVESNTRENRAP